MPESSAQQVADPAATPRGRLVADTSISVLADRGSRGLTHRAVDREAGLAEGSTSNLFRTRDALLAATLRRQVEREMEIHAAMPDPRSISGVDDAARWMAELIDSLTTTENAELVSARYELFLEGRRRPAFRDLLDEVRAEFTRMVAEVLASLHLEHAKSNSTAVLVTMDGLTANQVFHRASALTTREMTAQLSELLLSFSPD